MRLFLLFVIIPFFAGAQINTPTWGVEDTSFCIVKSTDFIIVHDYLELYNNSGTDLQMQWVLEMAPDWPLLWQAGFTDPDSVYSNVLIEDTGNFVIPYPIEFSNKLILDVDHNWHIDTSYLRFKVYPVNFPEDSLWLKYCVIITAPDVSVSEITERKIQVWFNKDFETIQFSNHGQIAVEAQLFGTDGKLILTASGASADFEIPVSDLERGIYFVHIACGDDSAIRKIMLY